MWRRSVWVTLLVLSFLWVVSPVFGKKSKTELQGNVIDAQGSPLAQAAVVLTPVAGGEVARTETDKKGEFKLTLAVGGEYQLRVVKEGYASFDGEVTLTEGEGQSVEIKMSDAAAGRKRDAVLAFNAGVKALESGDQNSAKAKFLEAAELDPTLGPPHLALADAYLGEGNAAQAAIEIEAFLATAPEDPQGLRLAYRIYQQLGDAQKLALLLEAVRNTDFAKTLAVEVYNEGAAATEDRDYERAAERFTTALRLDSGLKPAYEGLAQVQYHLERYQEALTTAAKLLEIDPKNLQGRRTRFLVYDALDLQDKLPEALAAYQEVDPHAAIEVLYQRAEINFRTGESAKAKAALLEILKQKPDMARAHYTLGLVYASESANAKAREHLERFLALAPDDPEAGTARDILKYL